MAYDNKFKQKVMDALAQGHTQISVSKFFGIGTTTIKAWRKRLASGTLFDVTTPKRKPKKLEIDKLRVFIESNPDAYLSEIASEFDCSSAAVCKMLKKLGITRKKRR